MKNETLLLNAIDGAGQTLNSKMHAGHRLTLKSHSPTSR